MWFYKATISTISTLTIGLNLASAATDFDTAALVISCHSPSVNAIANPGTPVHVNPLGINTLLSEQTILLAPTTDAPTSTTVNGTSFGISTMCVFSRWTKSYEEQMSREGYYFPLGRSVPTVDGGNWKSPPGKGSRNDVKYKITYVCDTAANSGISGQFSAGDYLCQVTLPMTSKVMSNGDLDELDAPYYLTYYERTLSVRNEISRFLQKVTFGPTRDELDALEAAFATIQAENPGFSHAEAMEQLLTEYVSNQMDPSTFSSGKFTSHREYYRKRLNPRQIETYRIGESGPAPCEQFSRWRQYAFTQNDVQNSKYLRWGTGDLGGVFQSQNPAHVITVETIDLGNPDGKTLGEGESYSPSSSSAPSLTWMPSLAPSTEPPSMKPSFFPSHAPSLSLAPTGSSILPYGDMEGNSTDVLKFWTSKCTRSVYNATSPSDPNVYSGENSLFVSGGRCFLYRRIGSNCPSNYLSEPLNAGDTVRVSLRVKATNANTVFQVYTGHYHASKVRKWSTSADDSYLVSRTMLHNADEWYHIEAYHTVGDDWTFDEGILTPKKCNHYQLRFRAANSVSSFYLDDVRIDKIGTPLAEKAIQDGFILNPDFAMDHKYWKYASTSGYVEVDDILGKNVMVLKKGKALRQNVLPRTVPNDDGQFSFWVRMLNMDSVDIRVIFRMRFQNNDLVYGPCQRKTCIVYERPLATTLEYEPGQKGWMKVTTDKFNMFGSFDKWDGTPQFILMELVTKNMPTGGELRVSNFEIVDEFASLAPSSSAAPSFAPTTLIKEGVGYIVRYAGEIRTVVRVPFQDEKTGEVLPMDGSRDYELCELDEVEGRLAGFPNRMNFLLDGVCKPIKGGNPTVNLDPTFVTMEELNILDLSNANLQSINVEQTYGGDWLLQSEVVDDTCATLPDPYDNDYRGGDKTNPNALPGRFQPDKPVFALLPGDNGYALYDPRLILHENSLELPSPDGGGASAIRSTMKQETRFSPRQGGAYYMYHEKNSALCMNEQPNFVNRETCQLSYEPNACYKKSPELVDVSLALTFDDASLAAMHDATAATSAADARYIYAVSNLVWDGTNTDGLVLDLPCGTGNPKSRWIPKPELAEGDCSNSLQADTNALLKSLLENSIDENPNMRDIVLWNNVAGDGCNVLDEDKYGMMVFTAEGCWENVHPEYWSIFDFTSYLSQDSSITSFTSTGVLDWSATAKTVAFETLKDDDSLVTRIARYGDKMTVDSFGAITGLNADRTVLTAIADNIASLMVSNQVETNRGGGVLMCGSPGEIAPDPTLDDYFDVGHSDLDCIGCQDSYDNYNRQKVTVWALSVLEGEDQLCQRMAWALYEHLNVGTTSNPDNSETNLYTYDIFIRNCFGNYFDVLKEMTYSPKMGEQFNFVQSTSTRWLWEQKRKLVFPDENMAREIMQLYTIGLHELELDGSETRDVFGRLIQTYNNLDILSNARIFTGFEYTARRGNYEELFRSDKSRMEPMRVEIDKHDFFPKSSVDGGWIGDRYPLCIDLPPQHFLKVGATYRFRGGSSLPASHFNPQAWDANEEIKRFVLSPDSNLYQKLCQPDQNGDCNFANTVVLEENLGCTGKECRVDTIIIIQVKTGFYEYMRPPCTHFSFFEGAKKVVTGTKDASYARSMCAHPQTAVAGRSCCINSADRAEYNYKFEYHGEVVTAATNEQECVSDGGIVCDPNSVNADNSMLQINTQYQRLYHSRNAFFWSDASCTQQVKVRDDGMIAILHDSAPNPNVAENPVSFVGDPNAVTFFSIPWEIDPMNLQYILPTPNNTCGEGACTVTDDDYCLCAMAVSESAVFDSLPTRDEILSTLHVGAFAPEVYSEPSYSLHSSSTDVEAFVPSTSNTIADTSTIFKVVDEFGEVTYLKNIHSNVTLGGTYTFRNPVSFIDLVKVEDRDAEYEIDAFLKHLIRYRSAVPFISKKLIQYFGISNPSPEYVTRVVNTFFDGSFTNRGSTFGNGVFGDLAAVAAAITLDPESVSSVTDEDPSNGNLREPLLKLMQLMRSLSFERRENIRLRHGLFDGLAMKLGQLVFSPPDQFSFFSTEYSPPGAFASAELVSPEAQLLSVTGVVGFTTGLFSFLNFGLAYADAGFGPWLDRIPEVGDTSSSMGFLSFQANGADLSTKIDDLATMMTAGRLSAENKQVLIDSYSYFGEYFGDEVAMRVITQLMTALPEFHTSNTFRRTGSPRAVTPPPTLSAEPYKAIVFVNLFGGADSFNILTPHSDGGCYLYDDYFEARGGDSGIGLKIGEILPIDGSSARISGCDTFGVNALLPAFKDIYDEGNGMFMANMGHLHKTVTQETWLTETTTDLFSHHTMKAESHRVDAFKEADGPGVLGRMLDVLAGYGHSCMAHAVNTKAIMVDGSPSSGRQSDQISTEGIPRIFERAFLKDSKQQLRDFLAEINSESDYNSGMFSDLWAQSFTDIWNKTDIMSQTLRGITLSTKFSKLNDMDNINEQMELVAKLIAARNQRGNGVNRDVFYVQMGGFDGHFNLEAVMKERLPPLNRAIASFWAEMKAQGVQNQITVVQGSEFGRTITPNSNRGSDHAWGGNYFVFGGEVYGGRILGDYPRSFGESDPHNIGRGRLIPSRSWDSLWFGIAQWFGITNQPDLDIVIPNNQNFGCDLFTDLDLYYTGTQFITGCGGPIRIADITFQIPEIRFLTGEEQKEICKLAIQTATRQFSFDPSETRCFVSNQVIEDSEVIPGFYDVSAVVTLNFDEVISPTSVSEEKMNALTRIAASTASDFVVLGAVPQTEAPSVMPSAVPSISTAPSVSPSVSLLPTVSTEPSVTVYGPLYDTATSTDIGSVGFSGYSSFSSGNLVIQGSGQDIWDFSDSFHYFNIQAWGDVAVTMLVQSFSAAHSWAKGGIMIRDTLSASSQHYSLFQTPAEGIANQYREVDSGVTAHSQTDSSKPTSVWLRVEKQGNTFSSYIKYVGATDWTPFGTTLTILFSTTFYVGVAVTSHDNTQIGTLYASNFDIDMAPLKCNGDNPYSTASCCTTSNLCDIGEGDCDSDSQCLAGLKCGVNNCNKDYFWGPASYDCCYDPNRTNECIGWRQTGGCVANGPREPQFDKDCSASIDGLASGYCLCSGSVIGFGCGHGVINCNDVCANSLSTSSKVATLNENISSCPAGKDLTYEQCANYAPTLTQDLTTLTDASVYTGDWSNLPCGCFLYQNQNFYYDGNCGNRGSAANALSICSI